MHQAEKQPSIPWSIHYSDGSGNGLSFVAAAESPARFEFDPVQPQFSSSGTYSGGTPGSGELPPEDATRLWAAVSELEAATELHVTQRMKGTGQLHVVDASGERRFIIGRCPQLVAFDEWTRRFRSD